MAQGGQENELGLATGKCRASPGGSCGLGDWHLASSFVFFQRGQVSPPAVPKHAAPCCRTPKQAARIAGGRWGQWGLPILRDSTHDRPHPFRFVVQWHRAGPPGFGVPDKGGPSQYPNPAHKPDQHHHTHRPEHEQYHPTPLPNPDQRSPCSHPDSQPYLPPTSCPISTGQV